MAGVPRAWRLRRCIPHPDTMTARARVQAQTRTNTLNVTVGCEERMAHAGARAHTCAQMLRHSDQSRDQSRPPTARDVSPSIPATAPDGRRIRAPLFSAVFIRSCKCECVRVHKETGVHVYVLERMHACARMCMSACTLAAFCISAL